MATPRDEFRLAALEKLASRGYGPVKVAEYLNLRTFCKEGSEGLSTALLVAAAIPLLAGQVTGRLHSYATDITDDDLKQLKRKERLMAIQRQRQKVETHINNLKQPKLLGAGPTVIA